MIIMFAVGNPLMTSHPGELTESMQSEVSNRTEIERTLSRPDIFLVTNVYSWTFQNQKFRNNLETN